MLIDQDPVMLSALTFKRRKFPAVVMDARAPFVWLELWETPGKAGNMLDNNNNIEDDQNWTLNITCRVGQTEGQGWKSCDVDSQVL